MNLLDFMRKFDTEEKCIAYLEELKGPMKCRKCGNRMTKLKGRKEYWCSLSKCRYQQSLTNGTIFHRSKTPLQRWFLSIHLISNSKKGMSAKQLAKEIQVTYKTARRIFHQIRKLMKTETPLFEGISEVDETYVGGRRRGTKRKWHGHKTMVMGVVNRDTGQVHARTGKGPTTDILETFILTHVKKHSRICSDELLAYKGLHMYYTHDTVEHGAHEYVVGDVHTNTIEGFWSQLKRGILGIYHQVSKQRLQAYVDEFSFRYNHRKSNEIFSILLNKI